MSKKLEQQYRQSRLKENLSAAEIVLAVAISGILIFLVNDYRIFGTAMPFPALVGIRLAICTFSVGVWMKLRSAVGASNPQKFDQALVIWCAVLTVAQVSVSFLRSENDTALLLIRLLTILLMYCFLPLPLLQQSLPAVAISIGTLLSTASKSPIDGGASATLAWTIIAANVLGISISRQLHCSARMQFLGLEREKQVRTGLESALAELKTLHGIIPICSHCKNIRDDAGSWQQLEEYISRRSDAQFSHGVCPHCIKQFYPDF